MQHTVLANLQLALYKLYSNDALPIYHHSICVHTRGRVVGKQITYTMKHMYVRMYTHSFTELQLCCSIGITKDISCIVHCAIYTITILARYYQVQVILEKNKNFRKLIVRM